jgi:hypothetical protein
MKFKSVQLNGQRGDEHENAKIGWSHLKILLSRTTEPEKLIFT